MMDKQKSNEEIEERIGVSRRTFHLEMSAHAENLLLLRRFVVVIAVDCCEQDLVVQVFRSLLELRRKLFAVAT